MAPTQTALADALGMHRRTIASYVKRDDWPFGNKNFNVAKVKAWLRENIARGKWAGEGRAERGEQSPVEALTLKQQADLRCKLAQAALAEQKHEINEGMLIARDDVMAGWIALTGMVRARIEEWIAAWPAIFASDPGHQDEIRAIAEADYDRLCDDMSRLQTLRLDDEKPAAKKDQRKVKAARKRHDKPA